MKNTEEEKIEKFKVPEVINSDLTYYMQFGWKRLREPSSKAKSSSKFLGNTYEDNFPIQVD
tara:strand:+ start:812 stop:994 length:183 start_codon:yes stop_codon:yes gene_type:complete